MIKIRISRTHLIGILLLFVILLVFLRISSTGNIVHTSAHSQSLGIEISDSKRFALESLTGNPVHLTSFSLAGEVTGDGAVAAYLEAEGTRTLVFTNLRKDRSKNIITGLPTTSSTESQGGFGSALFRVREDSALPFEKIYREGMPPESGRFSESCEESCSLEPESFNKPDYNLLVFVEEGTEFLLARIRYVSLDIQ